MKWSALCRVSYCRRVCVTVCVAYPHLRLYRSYGYVFSYFTGFHFFENVHLIILNRRILRYTELNQIDGSGTRSPTPVRAAGEAEGVALCERSRVGCAARAFALVFWRLLT